MLSQQSERVFHEDVGLRSYSSARGNVRGVQVTRISPELQRFGVQSGDVLLELNGKPVRSKAEALAVGRKQYQAGVRVFRAKVLNRYGRQEERTYYAPNQ